MNKNLIIGIIVALLVAGPGYYFYTVTKSKAESDIGADTGYVPVIENSTNGNTTTGGTPTTNSIAPGEEPPASYTLAQVATHADAKSCWSTINGGVYDLTSWIGKHPGGKMAILSICGKDGSDSFNGKHGGQARPMSELAGFKIGTLKQ